MYDQILFPTDGSEGANAVFDHVLELAASHESTLHIITIADTSQHSVTRVEGEVIDTLEQEGEEIVEEMEARAENRDVSSVTDVIQGTIPSTIVEYADEYDINLVTMATRGRKGLEQRVIGSNTEQVIQQTDVPVLALSPDANTFQ